MKWIQARWKAVAALIYWVINEAYVVNALHPDARVTTALTILGLLGVGAVHQVTNKQGVK